jgi:putative ABC transport system permease protein
MFSFDNLFRAVLLALKSLMLHKLRSSLTMLGIVLGVFSVIAMLAIGEGASVQAQQQVLALGATNIIVLSVKPPTDNNASSGGGSGGSIRRGTFSLQYGLLRSDFKLLTETVPTVTGAIPVRETPSEARYGQRTLNARIVGCTPEYMGMNHLELQQGHFLTDQHSAELANVCVLGAETASTLFPFENPVGQAVQLRNYRYKVLGVTRTRTASAAIGGSLSGQDFNKDVYIPLRTFQARIGDRVMNASGGTFSSEDVQLNQITMQVKDIQDVLPTAQVIRETLERTHAGKKDWSVTVPLELIRQADQIRQIFNVVLGSIAAISLLVGGIGIMNIMLATVTERTREIGIRRALGARRSDIVQQFLTETIVLAGAGGLIGILLGLGTPLAFDGIQWVFANWMLESSAGTSPLGTMFSDMQPVIVWWSPPLAFGISVGIGVVFGIYPARAAAYMDPIEALRRE